MSVSRSLSCLIALACFAVACADEAPEADLVPGPGIQEELQSSLIAAVKGDVLVLGPGRYELSRRLVIDKPVTLRGWGMGKTVLDFSQIASGSGDGILIVGNRVRVQDLTIENTPGDAIRLQQARDLIVRRVRIDWPGEPGARNGAYGLYPIQCEDVLFEDNEIRGAADSGIYVGQSKRVLVQRNTVTKSVAGIEIENSLDVDARDNDLSNNAAGILAFALPDLPMKSSRRIRIGNNRILDNNGPNFARRGALVAAIPSGTGIVVMAADEVEVVENEVSGHQTSNLSIYSYAVLRRDHDDSSYDPFSEGVWIHGNRFAGGGDDPQGVQAEDLKKLMGLPFPDIVFDGTVNPSKLVGGSLPPEQRLYIEGNGTADFINLDFPRLLRGERPQMSRDLSPHRGTPPAVSRPAPPQTT